MGLNIKNDRVHALAKQAALAAGTTQTGAIEQALIEFLQRLAAERDPAGPSVDQLVDAMHARITTDVRAKAYATAEALYDDRGLPR